MTFATIILTLYPEMFSGPLTVDTRAKDGVNWKSLASS